MTRRATLPPPVDSGPFAVRDGLQAGVSRHRLDAHDLERPFHGVRAPAGSLGELLPRCVALSTRFRDGDAFAGRTAAALWGMPSTRGEQHRLLLVSSRPPLHPMRRRGVVGTRRSHEDIAVLSGVALTSPIGSWIELAAEDVSISDLVAAADWAVTPRRGRPALLNVEELAAGIDAASGRRGVSAARRALRLVRVGAWSPTESHVRVLLARHRLPEPALNLLVAPGIVVDLGWPEYRVAVEYNGVHHDGAAQRIHDLSRAEALEVLGWSIVNIDRAGLYRAPQTEVSRVAQRLRSRGWRGRIVWPKTASGDAAD
jgi:very-short-patch-repair endonuclease